MIRQLCATTVSTSDIDIPGLLFIDTPGHEAFTSLRKRGGSISDLAILIVDLHEGFEPQTDESLTFLKDFETPFIVAATKVDKIKGWKSYEDSCFNETYNKQRKDVKQRMDNKLYDIMGDLSERGFTSQRFDKVDDFQKNVGIVPVSGITGEGVPDLLAVLIGLSQKFLSDELKLKSGMGKGNVLEVKETKGLGTTIDVILYEGEIEKGDTLVIGGKEPKVTRVKALLEPRELKELRTEKQFERIDKATAACGIKVSAPDLDGVVAGSPIRSFKEGNASEIKKEMMEEVSDIEIDTEGEGITLKADTLGSLEAMIKILEEKDIPIRKAKIGDVTRKDVMEEKTVDDPLRRAIFAFNVDVTEAARKNKDDVKIFQNSVIYKIIEDFEEWKNVKREELRKKKLENVTRPGKIRVLPGYVFRQRKPAVVGCEVLGGVVKPGYSLVKDDKIVGEVQQIQKDGVNVKEADEGDKVAISISNVTIGRQVDEGDELYNALSSNHIRKLEKLKEFISESEKRILREVREKIFG